MNQLDPDIAVRARRVADGIFIPADIPRLFNWARNLKPADEILKDIGDADSHRYERTQGQSLVMGRHFCALVRLRMMSEGTIPPCRREFVKTRGRIFKYCPQAEVEMAHNRPYSEIASAMKRAHKAVQYFDGINVVMDPSLSPDDRAIYNTMYMPFSIPVLYIASDVAERLFATLCARGALERNRHLSFMRCVNHIARFVLSRFHLSQLRLGDIPGTAIIKAGVSSADRTSLVGMLHYTAPEIKGAEMRVRIVDTPAAVDRWTNARPHAAADVALSVPITNWNDPLDLDGQGRLVPLV